MIFIIDWTRSWTSWSHWLDGTADVQYKKLGYLMWSMKIALDSFQKEGDDFILHQQVFIQPIQYLVPLQPLIDETYNLIPGLNNNNQDKYCCSRCHVWLCY